MADGQVEKTPTVEDVADVAGPLEPTLDPNEEDSALTRATTQESLVINSANLAPGPIAVETPGTSVGDACEGKEAAETDQTIPEPAVTVTEPVEIDAPVRSVENRRRPEHPHTHPPPAPPRHRLPQITPHHHPPPSRHRQLPPGFTPHPPSARRNLPPGFTPYPPPPRILPPGYTPHPPPPSHRNLPPGFIAERRQPTEIAPPLDARFDSDDSSTDDDTSSGSSDAAESDGAEARRTMRKASRLTEDTLYESYRLKLRRKAAASPDTKRNTGSELVKSFIDYVRVLEERVDNLEAGIRVGKDKTGASEGKDEKKEKNDKKEDEAVVEKEEKPLLKLDAAFFHAAKEFTPTGQYRFENLHESGYYTSNVDPERLVRVLYEWDDVFAQKARPSPTPSAGFVPEPDSIQLIAIGITSEPIAKFFREQLGFMIDGTHLLRFSRPFRPLIRNWQTLKNQLAKLENMFGSMLKETSDNVGDPKPEESEPQKQETKEGGDAGQADVLPFPPSTAGKDKMIKEYDRPNALMHFRVLIQTLEPYLGRKLALLERFKNASERSVSFEDLWMLFDSGDTIFSKFHEGGQVIGNNPDNTHITKRRDLPQAYRVVATAGGLPRIRTQAPKQGVLKSPLDGTWLSPAGAGFNSQLEVNSRDKSRNAGELGPYRMKNRYAQLFVYCFYIDFDGVKYGTVPEIFTFKPYEGVVDVESLDAYPIQYMPGMSEPEPRDLFLERGRRFIDVTTVSHTHMTYEGLTIGNSREEINSPVIVDLKLSFQEYRKMFPDPESIVPTFLSPARFWHMDVSRGWDPLTTEFYKESISSCGLLWCHTMRCTYDESREQQRRSQTTAASKIKFLLEDYEVEKTDQKENTEKFKRYMEKHDLIRLLPGVVPAFALRDRKWVQLDLGILKPVKREDGWKALVLPKGHREMVQAMVETHTKGSRSTTGSPEKIEMDLVRGKGKGCIILLHGAPGVGKTSTAECVAAYTGRPLYPITCGDIGYRPEAVEMNMGQHFKLAHKWGCVLLLDEADVFLAKRDKSDIQRNGLVSVFLRILEYYSGILFITTNRVGVIDDAFRSRLHLTLFYPRLDKRQTIKVWRMNLERLKTVNKERAEHGRPKIKYDSEKIIGWVRKHWKTLQWNGRQIRNAFQTAVALAEFKTSVKEKQHSEETPSPKAKSPVLNLVHFKVIARASIDFNEYLLETHGYDEVTLAKRAFLRADPTETKTKGLGGLDDDDDEDDDDDSENEDRDNDDSDKLDSDSDAGDLSAEDEDEDDEDDDDDDDDEDEKLARKRKKGKGKKNSEGKPKASKKGKGTAKEGKREQ